MVLHKKGDKLYAGVREELSLHLLSVRQRVVDALDANSPVLQVVLEAWNDNKVAMNMIKDILMYMDRVFVTQKGLDPVYTLGLHLFRDNVAKFEQIKHSLIETMLAMVAAERAGEIIDRYASITLSVTFYLVLFFSFLYSLLYFGGVI